MTLRDRAEAALRSWNAHELATDRSPVIDFDCFPEGNQNTTAVDRVASLRVFEEIKQAAVAGQDTDTAESVTAHARHLRALLGHVVPLDLHVAETQGCRPRGWPAEHRDAVLAVARGLLARDGIGWDQHTAERLRKLERPLDLGEIASHIEQASARYEAGVREFTGTDARFDLTIESVDVDDYWSYWLDGAGEHVRLRINTRRAQFTEVRARQFALHEVLGHGLQYASLAAQCRDGPVTWVRCLSVHAPHQVLCEGLAQTLPLFVAPDDVELVRRVQLGHYLSLVHAELHLMLATGSTIEQCVEFARRSVPTWTDEEIADLLADRGADPLLRSYLWAYPAGLDWFAALADRGNRVIAQEVIRAAYRAPLTPRQLTSLWPAGPAIGGPGRASVRVRQPPVR